MMEKLEIRTPAHACMVDITARVEKLVRSAALNEGVCHLFVPHTTAGITINENADPTVQSDILRAFDKIVPWQDSYSHSEGNAAAHIKASMMGASQTVLISGGRLQLGTWQGIFLAEFDGPRARQVWVRCMAG